MSEMQLLENTMNIVLSGNTLKNALDFTAFLREHRFQIEYNPNEESENKWTGAIGGVVGDSIGYLYICSGTNFPNPWSIWLNELEYSNEGLADDDELNHFIWENINPCGKCNSNWEKCGGVEKTILGKKFDRLCHSPMIIYTPDTHKLDKVKKLMLKLKQKKDGVQYT